MKFSLTENASDWHRSAPAAIANRMRWLRMRAKQVPLNVTGAYCDAAGKGLRALLKTDRCALGFAAR